MKIAWSLLLSVTMLPLAGCQFGTPRLFEPPPSAEYQQKRAQRFDPYPENETATPIDGGRPRDFDRALPETTRARWAHW